MAWPKGKSRKPTGETDMPAKTLDDFTAEINAAKVQDDEGPNPNIVTNMQAEAPNKKAVKMPAISQATRETMLAELAKKFSTTPEEIAERLKVGDPAPIGESPNNEIEELPAGTVLIPVKLKRDYWAHKYSRSQWPSSGDNRFVEGSTINLPGKEARRLIASGAAVRNDPMPDEEF